MSLTKRINNAYDNAKQRARACGKVVDHDRRALASLIQLKIGTQCPYCPKLLDAANFSVDHRQPLARGGDFSLSNLVVCCEHCNRMKGPLTEAEFRQLVHLLLQWPTAAYRNVASRLRAGGKIVRGL